MPFTQPKESFGQFEKPVDEWETDEPPTIKKRPQESEEEKRLKEKIRRWKRMELEELEEEDKADLSEKEQLILAGIIEKKKEQTEREKPPI